MTERSNDCTIDVSLPDHEPELSDGSARALLQLLRNVARVRAESSHTAPDDTPDGRAA